MIDATTKQRIIDLYKEGKNKTKIHNVTKVSLPSIRSIINNYKTKISEQESNRKKYNEDNTAKLSELENRITKLEEDKEIQTNVDKKIKGQMNRFIINTTKNSPYGNNTPYQILKNGVPTRDLPRVLGLLFPQPVVDELMNKIKQTGNTRGIYEATVIEEPYGIISTLIRVL